tara:strand:- start:228 stop:1349 length:1122 start_codon:yes stop_codon:yes gene_type:complete
MAYNVLDGTVDYSTTQHPELVDAHANQEIKGTKIIVGDLLAKDGRPIVPPAITELEGRVKKGIITYQGETTAKAEMNLTFDGQNLRTKHLIANSLQGSAEKLTNLPANQFVGKIDAQFLKLGPGLKDVRAKIQVDVGAGLTTATKGVEVSLSPKSGLSIKDNRVSIDLKNCLNVDIEGQNLSDDDIVMVHDTSRGEVRNTSLGNLYAAYINTKVPHCAGPLNSIQLKGSGGFEGSRELTYDPGAKVLNVDGTIVADALIVSGRTKFESYVTQNIKTVRDSTYEVAEQDYTLLCDTAVTPVSVMLPPACNYKGRIVIIKKINKDKFKLHSHTLTVKVEEGEIDFRKSVEMKTTYATLTIQSDGEKWWIIGKTGS